ncbi:MAG: hypothetical protein HWD59_05930 [Coxiellaceae bacterium]|nr:MAG: hypothetical protein HWD59_05930 [Coxiellaceae bacterium]
MAETFVDCKNVFIMDILKTNKTTVLSCIGAMGLHLLLLILFFYGMSHAVQNRVRSGEQNVKVISSFLYVQKMDGHRYTTSTPKENKAKDQQSFVKQEPLNAINTHVSTLRPVLTKTNSAKLQEKNNQRQSIMICQQLTKEYNPMLVMVQKYLSY